MAAEIDLINSGLAKLGEQALLSVTDDSPAGRLANRHYPDLRDALLREYPWNFATRRASLAAETTAPDWEFANSYPLPSDCLRVVALNNPDMISWRNENRRILTDLSAPLQIKYVAQITDVNAMDPAFRDTLAARLAMEWAEPLAQTTTVQNAMSTLYRNKLQVARVADGQEDDQQILDAPSYIDARF